MFNLELSDSLLQQIEAAGFTGSAVDDFVQQAIREKLVLSQFTTEERRKKFFDLSDEVRAAMLEQGLSEEELLAEFDARRHST